MPTARLLLDLKKEKKSDEAGWNPQPILSFDDAQQRPHPQTEWRSTPAKPPPAEPAPATKQLPLKRIRRRDRLGGLLHEYELAA
jgi:hypothetical protein